MKTTNLLPALMLCGAFFPLPNAWGLDATKDIRSDQTLTQQQKDELNAQAMKDLKRLKDQYEQEQNKADKKAIKYEKGITVTDGAITEKDQKVVDNLTEGALVTPNIFRTESGALKYVKILLKGDHNSFRYFRAMKTEVERKTGYDEAMESALSWLKPNKKEASNVIIEIIKTKHDYPKTVAEAARLIRFTDDKAAIPLLLDLTKHPDARVRCATASSLYDMGDTDTALPILKELIDNEASTEAMSALFDWRKGNAIKVKDERGYEILVAALENKRNRVRIEATRLLYEAKRISRGKAKQICIDILTSYKPMKNYGIMYDPKDQYKTKIIPIPEKRVVNVGLATKAWSSDRRACEDAVYLLKRIKDKTTIPALQKLINQTDDILLPKHAQDAIDYINGKSK